MHVSSLEVGDVIVSRKKVEPWQLVNRFFNWRVKRTSIKTFGPECVFPEANHVRTVVGRDMDDILWGFHWTYPVAKFCKIESWMVDSDYSMVFRYSFGDAPMGDYMNLCLQNEGKVYDVGQLLDTDFGFERFFDFGRRHHYCSSGALMLQLKLLGLSVPIKTEKAPPCLWANYPDLFHHLNPAKPGALDKSLSAPVLCEPT